MTALQKAFVTALVLVFFTFLLIGFPDHPHAQTAGMYCAPHDKMVSELTADEFKEVLIGRGLTKQKTMLEIYAHPDGKSWSIIVTAPNKVSCLVSVGEGWTTFAPKLDKKSSF